jgi:hypothetical protein
LVNEAVSQSTRQSGGIGRLNEDTGLAVGHQRGQWPHGRRDHGCALGPSLKHHGWESIVGRRRVQHHGRRLPNERIAVRTHQPTDEPYLLA